MDVQVFFSPLFVLTLQLLTLGFLLWLILPELLVVLGFSQVQGWVEGSGDDVGPQQKGGVPDDLYQELTALGFTPQGVYYERCGTSRTFRENVFSSALERTFAAVYELFVGERPRVAFITHLANGGLIFTQAYSGGLEVDVADFRAGPAQAATLVEVLEEHRHRMRRFLLAGQTPTGGYTLDDFAGAQQAFNAHPVVRQSFGATSKAILTMTLCMTLALPALLALYFGFRHPIPWFMLLTEAAIWGLARRYGAACLTESAEHEETPCRPGEFLDDEVSSVPK